MKKILFFLFVLLAAQVQAQKDSTVRLTGTVTDKATHEPLSGASISWKQGANSTLTGSMGQFSLLVNVGPLDLSISFAEYETVELNLPAGTTHIDIELEKKMKGLGEVTVVSNGFTTSNVAKSTGSYTVIDKKLFNEQIGTTVVERLKYIASGVSEFSQRVGGAASGQLLIRGLSTFSSQLQKPLIILDNFEYQGSLDNINPNDVENISILKDAAAAAIWGAKAANGVIVITTRRASYNQPLQISLQSNWSYSPKPDLQKMKSMSASDYIESQQFFFDKGFYNGALGSRTYQASELVLLLDKVRNGQLTQAEADQQIAVLRNTDVRREFEKYFYKSGLERQQSLSLQGGSGNYAWLLSGGYDENVDNLDASYRRLTGRMENRLRLTNRLELTANLAYTNSRGKDGRPGYGDASFFGSGNLPPYTRFANEQGQPLPLVYRYNPYYVDTVGQGLLQDWHYYPLRELGLNKSTSSIQDFQAVLGIGYQLARGLRANILYRYEKQFNSIDRTYDRESFLVRDLVNNYAQIDYTNREVQHIVPLGGILDQVEVRTLAQNLRGQLEYLFNRGQHSFTWLGGGEISETITSTNGHRSYGYDPDRLLFAAVDYANFYPLLTGGSSTIPNGDVLGRGNTRFVSFYTNAAYTFRERYTVSGSARRDASNLFGVRTNDKWKPLWSVGASWDLARESFYHLSWLPGARLRASYGHQGQVDPRKVAVTTFEYIGMNPYTQTPFGELENFPNDNLKWEQSAMMNLGLDLLALKGRIRVTADRYWKTLTDLYAETEIDLTAGVGPTIIRNIGKMRVKGWDIRISSINTTGIIGWQSDLLLNSTTNKVVKLYKIWETPSYNIGTGFLGVEGYSLYSMFTFRWAGLDPVTGGPRGYLNGQASSDYATIRQQASFGDIIYNGSILPKITGSLGNTISWKALSLTARISYKLGYVIRRNSIDYSNLAYSGKGHVDFARRWQQPGDEAFTEVPSFIYPVDYRRDEFYLNTEALVEKGDHLRFEYVNLSYQLDKSQLRKLPFGSLQFRAIVNNIGIIWRANKHHLDPDFADDAVPRPRVFSIGLNANF